MSFSRDQVPSRLGFDPSIPESRAFFAPALALALAFLLLPFGLLTPFDVDRSLPLLFVPAVWLGWKISRPASPALLWLVAAIFAAMLVSTTFAGHSARALVSVSAVAWVLAGGMVARNLAPCLPAVRLVLGGIGLGAVAGAVLVARGAGLGYMDFPVYWGARIFGMHQFAGAIAALIQLRLAPPRHPTTIPAALIALAALTALGTASSRAGLVGLAVFLGFAVWRGGAEDRRFILTKAAPLVAAAFLIAYWIGQPFNDMGLASALQRTAAATSLESVSSARSYFWSVVWQQVWNSPWIGHGADAYQYIQPRLHGAQPHNMLLQWLYEYGVAGTLPLILLLFTAIAGAFGLHRLPEVEIRARRVWFSSAVAGASAFGLFDGVFYHMVVFMPVAAFAGFALGDHGGDTSIHPLARLRRLLRPALLLALIVLLLHGWLGLMLMRAPNVAPTDPAARLLRVFPSTTHGLDNWLNHWKHTNPDVVPDWITWAQTHSNQQPEYHLAAVQIYLNQRDFISAERELRACLPKVRDIEVADVERLLAGVAAKAREQAATEAAQGAK